MPTTEDIRAGEDTISILVTTDNHVGYSENDPIIGDDTWRTFEEITQIAKIRDVDMILQGGDLFHVNKPSKKSMFHVMKSLRKNCMGDRPCELELLSDPSVLGDGFGTVNYEDPNLNISVPVFAISGNHDDATGEELLLPIDVLSVSGYLNFFGKIIDNENITVSPLLLRKGSTKLALYGFSNVKDERLYRIFRDGGVRFLRPNEDTDDWFNLLCVHQNHTPHSQTSYLPELFLPKFLQLIIWGHEHECIPHPIYNPNMDFDTLQPGSSVATSLCEAEASEKHVFLLHVNNKKYSVEPIKLRSTRPFIIDEISLAKERFVEGPASKDDITKFLTYKVEELVERAKQSYIHSNKERFDNLSEDTYDMHIPLPLIRCRVDYTGNYEVENPRRFANKFVGKVANVNDVIHYFKKKSQRSGTTSKTSTNPEDPLERKTTEIDLQDIVSEFLKKTQLNLIPEVGMSHAVKKYLENGDKYILESFIKNEIQKEAGIFLSMNINESEFQRMEESDPKMIFKSLVAQNRGIGQKGDAVSAQNNLPKSAKRLRSNPTSEDFVIADSDTDSNIEDHNGGRSEEKASRGGITNLNNDNVRDHFPGENQALHGDEHTNEEITSKKTKRKPGPKRKPKKDSSENQHENKSLLDDIMSMGSTI